MQDLPPSPTRRSSDLFDAVAPLAGDVGLVTIGHAASYARFPPMRKLWIDGKWQEDRKSTRPELQSRLHLVCRLLLEKKKEELVDRVGLGRGAVDDEAY